jgi:hypothetical protein
VAPLIFHNQWHFAVTENQCIKNCESGLPDGIFSYKKSNVWYFLEGLEIENVGIFCIRLEYFTGILVYFYPFGIFCDKSIYLVVLWYIFRELFIIFLPVLVYYTKKNLATLIGVFLAQTNGSSSRLKVNKKTASEKVFLLCYSFQTLSLFYSGLPDFT